MDIGQASLANLGQGWAGDRNAGRDLMVAAIAEAIAGEFASDDAVRFHLCKVWDFEVTPAVRAAVVAEVALLAYNAIMGTIKKTLIAGEDVSINGFATFRRVNAPEGWPVGIELASGAWQYIRQTDTLLTEKQTAIETPGGWAGSLDNEYVGSTHYLMGSTADTQGRPINAAVAGYDAAEFFAPPSVTVSGVAADGVARSFVLGRANIRIYGKRFLRLVSGNEGVLVFVPERDQTGYFSTYRASLHQTPEYVAANLGAAVPMGPQEWAAFQAVQWSAESTARAGFDAFDGMPAHLVLESFPRSVRIFRANGGRVYTVKRVPAADFRARYGFSEAALRAAGDWPEPVRNLLDNVKASFRPEVLAAMPENID